MKVAPVTLEGRVVRLEPLTQSHHAALCKVGLDPELWNWTNVGIASPEEMAEYIRVALAALEAGTALTFATVLRDSGQPIGGTRFMNIEPAHKRVEIGFTWIGRPWQRTAVNTEAKYLMLRHAFETWNCNRVEFKTDVLNRRSRDAILRIGATEEGILRRHIITSSGRVRDSVYYSILDSEWPRVKAELERKLNP
jgi:RimJ/RimL family protein N-acetyltransferase